MLPSHVLEDDENVHSCPGIMCHSKEDLGTEENLYWHPVDNWASQGFAVTTGFDPRRMQTDLATQPIETALVLGHSSYECGCF
jgi:hypothetical protein